MEENKNLTNDILNTGNIIIEIIKAELTGGEYSLPVNCDYKKLFRISENHKVTPLIADAVMKWKDAPEKVKDVFKKELFKANMRFSTQENERLELSKLFEENNIKFCFLKGYKVSRFYEKPELRYMLDMDIYIEESKFALAEEIVKNRGYELNTFGDDKDIGYIKKPFLNIELHKELKYDYDKGYDYYKGAFSRLASGESPYELNMTNEDFYVYILSHSAHHFENGGTGIRNILDHFQLKEKLLPLCDKNILDKNLNDTGLSVFNKKMNSLSDYWFKNGEMTEDIKELSDFILLSGVFGNQVNEYISGIVRGEYNESKSSYLLNRFFPPLRQMRVRYTVLGKLPWLLPFYWFVRLVSFFFSEKKEAMAEVKTLNAVDKEEKEKYKRFMQKNGL